MMRQQISRLRQAGFSLVEMMIGLAIGLVLTTGMFILISNTSNTFKVQDDFARMQDNATAAMRYIGGSLRMAGFYGYAQDPTVINTTFGGVATVTDCGSATNTPTANWALAMQVPIYGFSGITTQAMANATMPCIAATNFLAIPNGQQILVTRGAIGYRIPDPNNDGDHTDGIAAQRNGPTTVYVQADPGQGLTFYGANFAALRASGSTRTLPNGNDIDIFEYAAHVYYIRPCSRFAAGTSCTAAADDGKPVPTLVRQELQGSNMVEVGLAEGIERMSLLYGIDNTGASGPDGIADTFTATPAAGDWQNIVSVRVALLVRAITPTSQHDDSGKTYDLDGDNVADYDCNADVATTAACKYKRKVFSQLFQLRNISQRRGL